SVRPSIRLRRSPVRAKWPRWLVPNCNSKPSTVIRGETVIKPALLMSRSRPSCFRSNHCAKPRTESRLLRSSDPTSSSAFGTAGAVDEGCVVDSEGRHDVRLKPESPKRKSSPARCELTHALPEPLIVAHDCLSYVRSLANFPSADRDRVPVNSVLEAAACLAGIALVVAAMMSAMRVLVVPRSSRDRIARSVFFVLRRLFDFWTLRSSSYAQIDRLMAWFAPTGLLVLAAVWLVMVLAGYTGIFLLVTGDGL